MNLYLIGYRGSGKSTVARALSKLLDWPSVDADDEIEVLAGKTIAEIFTSGGEAEFRKLESSVIAGLSMLDRNVVALGGGAILAGANRDRIKATGSTVWLKISPKTSFERISADQKSASQRPNLTQTGGISEIEQMMAARAPIYQSVADFVVQADFMSPDEIAVAIFDFFEPTLLHS